MWDALEAESEGEFAKILRTIEIPNSSPSKVRPLLLRIEGVDQFLILMQGCDIDCGLRSECKER